MLTDDETQACVGCGRLLPRSHLFFGGCHACVIVRFVDNPNRGLPEVVVDTGHYLFVERQLNLLGLSDEQPPSYVNNPHAD